MEIIVITNLFGFVTPYKRVLYVPQPNKDEMGEDM